MKKILLMFLLLPLFLNGYAQQETTLEIRFNDQLDQDIFFVVDEPPKFKGGEKKLAKFYKKKSNFDIVRDRKYGQTIYFQIVINKDGSVTDFEILNNTSKILEAEVRRMVELMPLWNPGKKNGKPVRVKVTQEISFSVNDQ